MNSFNRIFINLFILFSTHALANEAIQDRIARIYKLLEKSEQALVYSRGQNAELIKAQSPDEIFISCVNLAEKISKVGTLSTTQESQVQSALLDALKALFIGKPATFSNNKKHPGWFLGNTDPNGVTGEKQIRDLLLLGILSPDTRTQFYDFASNYNPKDFNTRELAGFKGDFNGYINNHETFVSSLKSNSSSNTQSPSLGTSHNRPSFDEILQKALGQQADLEKFKLALQIKKNIYNEQIENLAKPDNQRIEFFGRAKEIQSAKTKLSLVNKGHIFFTGKAGVGKSTLVEMLQLDALKSESPNKTPIFLELSITLLTNDRDPTALTKAIEAAELLATRSGRKVILFIDESHVASTLSQNALKSALASIAKPNKGHVHFVFACTGDDSAQIFRDVAFARRWNEIYISEFTFDEAKASIQKTFVPLWQSAHPGFQNISDAAFEFAEEYSAMEQPFAGRPTNLKELLEAAIAHKIQNNPGASPILEAQDIRAYLRDDKGVVLFPGDPDFNNQFNLLWAKFEKLYPADAGFLDEIKTDLRFYFLNKDPDKVPSWIFMGPPGAGKSYLYDVISEVFFNTTPEVINTSELGSGGLAINKLIGSVAGTKDSKEAGILVKALKKMPQGGPIVFEEADYLSPDLLKFLVNTITSKKFRDGLGNEYDISKFIFVLVTNQGQEIALPPGGTMNWNRYSEILNSITQPWTNSDKTKSGRIVKPEIKAEALDKYLYRVFGRTSEAKKDTSAIEEDAAKFRRRLVPKYLFGPEKASLQNAFAYNVDKIKTKFKKIYGVDFVLTPQAETAILDIENFNFSFGYAYAKDRATQFVDIPLNLLLSETQSLSSSQLVLDTQTDVSGQTVLKLLTQQGTLLKQILIPKQNIRSAYNIWSQDNFAKKAFALAKSPLLNDSELSRIVSASVRSKTANPQHSFTLSWLGSKKDAFQTAQIMAKELYGEEDAFFSFNRLLNAFSLGDYIRPPGGIRNAEKETPFEKWLLSRLKIGGVILLDGILDFEGLSQDQVAQKLQILSQLETMISQNRLEIAGQSYDLSAFVFVLSGSPTSQSSTLSLPEIISQLSKLGLNSDKLKALGTFYVQRNLSNTDTLAEEFVNHVTKQFLFLGSRAQLRLPLDEIQNLFNQIKQSAPNVELSLNNLSLLGIDTLVFETSAQIEETLELSAIDQISYTFSSDGATVWLVNEEPVVLVEGRWQRLKSLQNQNVSNISDMSPQFAHILKSPASNCRPSLKQLMSFLGE